MIHSICPICKNELKKDFDMKIIYVNNNEIILVPEDY